MLIYFLARRPPRGLGSRRPRSVFLAALRNLFKRKVRCAPTSPGTPAPEGARALGAMPPLRVGTPTPTGLTRTRSRIGSFPLGRSRGNGGTGWRRAPPARTPRPWETVPAPLGHGRTPLGSPWSRPGPSDPGGQSPLIGPFRFGALVFVRCFNGVQDS